MVAFQAKLYSLGKCKKQRKDGIKIMCGFASNRIKALICASIADLFLTNHSINTGAISTLTYTGLHDERLWVALSKSHNE